MTRRAKIVATIGPASQSPDQIRSLFHAGMDVARLNFSHGTHETHLDAIETIRAISEEVGRPIGILQDLQGPRLRTGPLSGGGPVHLQSGATLNLCVNPVPGDAESVQISYPALPQEVRPGNTILVDGGKIELQVAEIEPDRVRTRVINGGELGENRGLNLPGIALSAPPLTEKDREDLALGLEAGVDWVALSFVHSAEPIFELRKALEGSGAAVPIIAKLERPEAVEDLENILAAADGVMVARGDLGVEISAERVPSIQKQIIQRANEANKLVITATEMLDSMIRNPRPTRAEASDVANAIFDGSDALMLSGETAVGTYPQESVETMVRIIVDAEAHSHEWGEPLKPARPELRDDAVATTRAARKLAEDRTVAAVAVFTRTGRTAQLMSKARPSARIVAFTPDLTTYTRMTVLWGVEPRLCRTVSSVEEIINIVDEDLKGTLMGQQVVIVARLPVGQKGPPNFVYLRMLGE
ncbi:MAG: pyruvate kinase [Chloroflexi bacterium]|nr:pyruvate kinase [Chloroflexota bacterium]